MDGGGAMVGWDSGRSTHKGIFYIRAPSAPTSTIQVQYVDIVRYSKKERTFFLLPIPAYNIVHVPTCTYLSPPTTSSLNML